MIARAVALVLGILAAGIAAPAAYADIPAPDSDPFYAVPANVGALPDGAIIRSRSITATAQSLPMPATAWQVEYKTVDNTGAPTATVTTIMVPTAPWTSSGPRPVVSYQTAEDGVGTKCAPSYAIRGGLLAPQTNSSSETQLMQQALLRGWTVVAPDYEGPRSMFLGAEGEARGVLNSLRAARAFAPAHIAASAPLGVWGYSGGAFATSVAAQLQPRYAPELKLSGVALGGVVGDLRATIHAFSGSFAGGALVMGFVAVDRSYPEYHLTQYLNDAARAAMANSQSDCITDAAVKYPFARVEQFTDNPAIIDGPTLKPLFERLNPLTFPGVPGAPVYDYHAIGDELAPIGPDRALIQRFCRGGVAVQKVEDAIGEHLTEVITGATGAMDYLGDRFAGKPAPNNCSVRPDPTPAPASGPAAPCPSPRARVYVSSLHATRKHVSMRGTASAPCDPSKTRAHRRIRRVSVSIARIVKGRCEYVGRGGRLHAPRSCRRPIAIPARGTRRWTLARNVTLRPGRYRVYVRATDGSGSNQALPARPVVSFRVP